MDPQDEDPEARIRELERPFTEIARSSELGAGPSGGSHPTPPMPPMPPPGSYGAPPPGAYGVPFPPPRPGSFGVGFPGSPRRTSGGFRALWWLLGLFAVGMVALFGGIASFVEHAFSSAGLSTVGSTPSTSAAPPSVPVSGGVVISIPSIPSAPVTGQPPVGGATSGTGDQSTDVAAPGGTLSVSGSNANKTIACNNSTVDVSGFSNTVVITGHCASLTVSGDHNVVTVDASDNIDASGFNNRVTFHSGSPQIDIDDDSNVVQQG
jgi:hypothetical protein